MKKILIRVALALVVLLILAVLAVSFFLDGIVRRGVETVGSMLTKVEIKLDSVSLSLLSGSGKLQGLVVGNPEGFKSPSAIQVGKASLALQPGSVFADKVIIKSINVQGPEITYETDLKGNNLSKILANVEGTSGGTNSTPPPAGKGSGPSRKLQVNDFLISGAKLHVNVTTLGNRSATVTLPEIHLTDLGTGPDGITAAELARRVLAVIEKESVQAASGAVADLSKQAAGLSGGVNQAATGAVNTVTKGIGNLLKRP